MKLSHVHVATILSVTLGLNACNSPKVVKPNPSGMSGSPNTSQNGSVGQPKPTVPSPVPTPAPVPNTGTQTNSGTNVPEAVKSSNDVIVQLFNYPFKKITEEMPALVKIGYGQIHVSPPNLTIATDQWWGRYQPVDYRMIAGPLGNETEFKAMIKAAHDSGIKIIVDIVFNHTNNPTSQLPPEAGQLVSSQGALFTAADYHPEACIKDYNNAIEVRNNRMCGGAGDVGLPDLDQNSAHVLEVQQDFLKRLNVMGVDGYRLDAVKHMEPSYFSKLLTPEIRKGKFIFGEIIADSTGYDRGMAPYVAADPMAFYDFPYRATIQKAFAMGGNMATLVDPALISSKKMLASERSVTFVMNHDLPNNDGFKGMILDPIDEQLAYAFLLGRAAGVPYVFSDLGIKDGAGLKSDRWEHAYSNEKMAKMVAFHNAVRGQPESVIAADGCLLILQRGNKGVVAINKCGETKQFSLAGKVSDGTQLTNTGTGEQIKVSGSTNVSINARSFILLLAP